MDLTPREKKIAASTALPALAEIPGTTAREVVGYVLAVGPADPIYGADEDARLALICDDGADTPGALVPVGFSKAQAPSLAVGSRVRIDGWLEPLTAQLPQGALEFGVLAAFQIQPA